MILVGVSGGADSVGLLCLLNQLGYPLHALHCNFHLRGAESDRDEAFVIQLCEEKGIPLSVRHFSTLAYAMEHQSSVEMAARDLRYEWFDRMRTTLHADCIAVGHHKEDQAETILLNLLRGTGLKGLTGMMPKRDYIVRPFLTISKQQIIAYLDSIHQPFVLDSTNLEQDVKRNRIRLDIIPQLQELNPNLINTLVNTGSILQESLPLYQEGVQATFRSCGITAESFPLAALSHVSARTLLFEWLRNKGFNAIQLSEIQDAANTSSGKVWVSHTHRLLRDRQVLYLESTTADETLPVLHQELVDAIGETGPQIAYFDADKIKAPIQIRKARKGDWFIPLGMKGRKLLSDFLTDRKCTLTQKQQQYVATCQEDIIWVIGMRSDERFKVTADTRRILKLIKDPR